MTKRSIAGAVVALAAIAVIAFGASVAEGSAGATKARTATPLCLSPANYEPVAALKAASGRQRDLVTNEYDLPTPTDGVSPFFTPNVTVEVYFHVISTTRATTYTATSRSSGSPTRSRS